MSCIGVVIVRTFEKPLTEAEESYYLDLWHNGDKGAKDILVERNLRLVVHMVKKYSYNEHDLEDLISIGTIGLIKAIDSFNAKKGNRLVTYAAKCIDNELLMTFRTDKKKSKEVSLNEPLGTDKEGNAICFQDMTFSEDEDAVERIQKAQDIQKLNSIFEKTLSERERYIIICRYGLYGKKEMTQIELAKQLGISRSYVSRIEKKALEKLKSSMEDYS